MCECQDYHLVFLLLWECVRTQISMHYNMLLTEQQQIDEASQESCPLGH